MQQVEDGGKVGPAVSVLVLLDEAHAMMAQERACEEVHGEGNSSGLGAAYEGRRGRGKTGRVRGEGTGYKCHKLFFPCRFRLSV